MSQSLVLRSPGIPQRPPGKTANTESDYSAVLGRQASVCIMNNDANNNKPSGVGRTFYDGLWFACLEVTTHLWSMWMDLCFLHEELLPQTQC